MGKAKVKIEHELLGIFLKVKCSKNGEAFEIEVSENDLYASSQECEICGSHGEVTVTYTCPVCGEIHDFQIKSW
jgi:transposase